MIKQFVGFKLGDEHYGVDIMGVEEIIRMVEIIPVPRAPSFVEGIINLRGRIIPVVDLRKRLSMPTVAITDKTRIIVMRMESRRLGFIVDMVEEVMQIQEENIENAPGMTSGSKNYIEGVARMDKAMIIILDVLKIFSPDEHLMIAQIK